jgi:hypothetical protein
VRFYKEEGGDLTCTVGDWKRKRSPAVGAAGALPGALTLMMKAGLPHRTRKEVFSCILGNVPKLDEGAGSGGGSALGRHPRQPRELPPSSS